MTSLPSTLPRAFELAPAWAPSVVVLVVLSAPSSPPPPEQAAATNATSTTSAAMHAPRWCFKRRTLSGRGRRDLVELLHGKFPPL
jgi:hypothetical protein